MVECGQALPVKEWRSRLGRFLRRAFPARVFCSAQEWLPAQAQEIVENAFRLIEPKARFIRAAKPNPDQYLWVCLKNAVRDQVWAMVPEDLRELHLALSTTLRKSNGFKRQRHLISLADWPTDTPPCRLDLPDLLRLWKPHIRPQSGSGRLGLKRGFLTQALRTMLTLAKGAVPRSWLYQSTRELLGLPQIIVGLPGQIESGQTSKPLGDPVILSVTGARRPTRFEDLFALQLIIDEQRPLFEQTARALFDNLTPSQQFFAWAQYHDWKHTKIAEHLRVGLSRISNLHHQYVDHVRKAIHPAWTQEETRAFLDIWHWLLHHEPRPSLPETRP